MKPLEPPDSFHLSAAHGWLELGMPGEGLLELVKISTRHQEHPDVLECRWLIVTDQKDWVTARVIAERHVKRHPSSAAGWVHLAYAVRRASDGGLQAAFDLLLPIAERFPKQLVIPYNLACYLVQMGRLEEGWEWLRRAVRAAGDTAVIRRMAAADDDLKPFWTRLAEL